jgi:hypothetical protein
MTQPDILDIRTLNRTLLARQGLLERTSDSVPVVLERLVGLQAQEPGDPYVGLWSRIAEFRPTNLADQLLAREAIRLPLLRATIHLVTTREAVAIRPLAQPVMDRTLQSQRAFAAAIRSVDREVLVAEATARLEEQPRTRAELRAWIADRFPEADASSLAIAVSYLVPVVQVPPRGVWGQTGQATWTTLARWVADRPEAGADPMEPETLIRRYLAAFGPASVADIRTWSGLAGLREVVDRIRPELRSFRDERGRELLDVADGVLADPETSAPVRYLPVYDNALLGHDDRSRIISQADRRRIMSGGPLNVGSVLVDGFAHAVWRVMADGDRRTLEVRRFRPLSPADEAAVGEEGERLLAFLDPGTTARAVVFRDLSTA